MSGGYRARRTPRKSVLDRVLDASVRDPVTGCLELQRGLNGGGYGTFSVVVVEQDGTRRHRLRLAHRIVFEAAHGPIPDGLVVRHKCDNRKCCELSHLELGTVQENIEDARRRGRYRAGVEHPNAVLTAELAREIYLMDAAYHEIASKLGVSMGVVSHVKNERSWREATVGLVKPPLRRRLSAEAVKAIFTSAEKAHVLADRYGVTPGMVSQIWRRWTYKDLTVGLCRPASGRPSRELVREVFRASGPARAVASKFGVAVHFVYRVRSRGVYADLTADMLGERGGAMVLRDSARGAIPIGDVSEASGLPSSVFATQLDLFCDAGTVQGEAQRSPRRR